MRPRSDSLRLGRVNLRPEKAYLRPLMADLRPGIANLRLGRVNFRSERAWEGQFHTLGFFGWGVEDGETEKISLYEIIDHWPLPKN